ncbi:MAG: hypothetical protein WAZ12_03805 [Candidatus Absconditicoccaceae bacterium]
MVDQTNLQKIENEKKLNIQKTIDYPIKGALKGGELKDTILSQGKNQNILVPNQVSILLDKYENRIIKKRKINL